KHSWMDEHWNRSASPGSNSGTNGRRESARVIPMTVRKDDSFNRGKLYAEPWCIAFQNVILRPGIKHHSVRDTPSSGRDNKRQSMVCTALRFAGKLLHSMTHQAWPFERYMLWNAGEAVETV